MKMKRNLIILGAVLVLAVAFVLVVPNLKPPAEPTPTPAATEDPELQKLSGYTADQVTELTLKNNSTGLSYTVYKSGDKYVVKGMEGREFDQNEMGSLVYNVANVAGERLIEQHPKDLSLYGLDKPQAVATAKYSDGKTNIFLLGDLSPAGNTHYMMLEGGDKVVTVWMNVGNSYLDKPDSLLAKQNLQLTQEEIETVTMLKKGETVVELTSLGEDKDVSITPWRITKPWKRSTDAETLSTFLQAVSAVSMNEVVEGDAKDLAQYGLDNPEYDVTISGKGKTDRILIGKDKDSTYAYAKFADSAVVYTVSKSALEFTKTSAYKLMDKMILLVNITSATGVEFSGLGVSGRMDIEHKPTLDDNGEQKLDGNGKPMYDQFFTVGGTTVEDKVARYFYQLCIGLQTHSLVKEGWQPSGEPVAVLTYQRNVDPKMIKIEFMAYDDDFYAVRMEDGTHFLIRKDKVQKVADDLKLLKAGELKVPQ